MSLNQKMVKAYSYIRMSTEVQLRGDSLRRQLELSKNYATKHGLELVDHIDGKSLHDIGISGYRGRNSSVGALSVFMDAVKSGKIEKGSYLLIESLDRLSRESIAPALNRFMTMINDGLVIVTLIDGAVYSEESVNANPGMLFLSMGTMIRANDESAMKSMRLAAAWENKRKLISIRPITSVVPAWVIFNKKSNKLDLIQHKADVVKKIFELCSNSLGIQGIVKYLNENKVPVFGRSKIWGKSYVAKIINNRAVLGEYMPHILKDGKRVPQGSVIFNYYPAVISEQVFINAHAAMERRKTTTRGRKGPNFGNIFTGLMFCKHCGEKMQYRDRGDTNKGGQYLVCKNKLSGIDCESPEWKVDELEALIFKHLKEVDLSSIFSQESSKVAALDQKISSCSYEYDNLVAKKKRSVDNLSELDLDEDARNQIVSTINDLNNNIILKNEEIKELNSEKNSYLDATSLQTSNGLKNFIEAYKKNYKNYQFRSEINELLRRAISKIELKQSVFGIDPTDFDENSSEIISYRKRSKKTSKAKLDDIVLRETFIRHCEWLSREIYIYYKYGDRRYISYDNQLTFPVKKTRFD
jgi:DNA invertase Pin-like site-specific DNA recombinase